jgi:hypothetical protein
LGERLTLFAFLNPACCSPAKQSGSRSAAGNSDFGV